MIDTGFPCKSYILYFFSEFLSHILCFDSIFAEEVILCQHPQWAQTDQCQGGIV